VWTDASSRPSRSTPCEIVVGVREPEGFTAFVAARSPALLRTAWLLTGDQAAAEDLVQEALARSWRVWDSIRRQDAPEVYVRRVIVTTYARSQRRRWRGEVATEVMPDLGGGHDPMAVVDLAQGVRAALARLPLRQRTVLVLRFYDDLTEGQTALVMGCTIGTVKSQTAKALAALRTSPLVWDAGPTDVRLGPAESTVQATQTVQATRTVQATQAGGIA
jgi:RNA polymerase sigma-70 factor (sigma-E family)